MAAATLVHTYRPGTSGHYYTVPTYADIALNGSTLNPGDVVKVVASGRVYLFVAPDTVVALGKSEQVGGFIKEYDASVADLVGEALTDTDTEFRVPGSGLRIHGQGLAETDSGVTIAYGAGGPVITMTTTDEADHLVALSFGGDTEMWTPAASGPFEVEAEVTMSSAITLRSMFLGFCGTMTAALDPVITGDTATITLVQDDLVGLSYDAALTDADRIYFAYNKANGAASQLVTAAGVDTGVDFPAAGTYVKLRVRVEADGTAKAYVNDVLVSTVVGASSTSVALNPVLYVRSTSTAVKTMLVKRFAARSLA